LLPFSLIAGLVAYVGLPNEPDPIVFGVGGAVVMVALLAAIFIQSLPGVRWGMQAAAFWIGLSLLPVHGGLVGTPMISFPAYGTYEARVDEIISATPERQRLVISR